MKIVTEHIESFREASPHIRNVYYVPSERDVWDKLDDFNELSVMRFRHLICAPLAIGYEQYEWFSVPAPIFKLRGQGTRLPIMINRNAGVAHGYWNHPINAVSPSDLELTFFSYFDWNPQGIVDHRYIMCFISGAEESKSVIGHFALVESHYVEVYHDVTANQ